jgi:hypothetical protein
VSSLLFLNHESAQKLFVGMLLLLLPTTAGGVPIMMPVVAQPTQGDSHINVDDGRSEINSQSQNPNNSSQMDY